MKRQIEIKSPRKFLPWLKVDKVEDPIPVEIRQFVDLEKQANFTLNDYFASCPTNYFIMGYEDKKKYEISGFDSYSVSVYWDKEKKVWLEKFTGETFGNRNTSDESWTDIRELRFINFLLKKYLLKPDEVTDPLHSSPMELSRLNIEIAKSNPEEMRNRLRDRLRLTENPQLLSNPSFGLLEEYI